MEIYIHKDGRVQGPFSLEEINRKALNREVVASDPAWMDGWAEWQTLSCIEGFASRPVPPPFTPHAAPSPASSSPLPTKTTPQSAPPTAKGDDVLTARRNPSRTLGLYVLGFGLIAIGVLCQEAAKRFVIPSGSPREFAAVISGIGSAAAGLLGLFAWYKWFRGRPGSVIMLFGLLAPAKNIGPLAAAVVMTSWFTSDNFVKSNSRSPAPAPRVSPSVTSADEFDRQRAKSKADAIALYPDVADHNTPLGREVDRLIQFYQESNNPILYSPDAPMRLTLEAARNLALPSPTPLN
jgi:hypothetical protein